MQLIKVCSASVLKKSKTLLLVLDFFSIKHAYRVTIQEGYNAATLDLLSFFLQTKFNNEDELILIKLTGVIALLLVAYDLDK